jgi:hypothetical protein
MLLSLAMAGMEPIIAHSQTPPDVASVQSDSVPSDDTLQARQARIGHIAIQVDDVFETHQPLAAPYHLANSLHITTRQSTIESQLLFKQGDVFSRKQLDETERLLRGQRYLNEASIVPVRYNDDNTVDVVVRVHDVWTLSPGLSFGRKGGANHTRAEFEDTNFLGLGKQLSFSRSSNVDRTAWELAYKDPNLLGTWWKLSTSYANLSDGGEKMLDLSRPFYALDSRWSFGVGGSDTTNTISEYGLGHVVDKYRMHEQLFNIGGGISRGLVDGWTTRYLAGARYESRAFDALPDDQSKGVTPDDRVYSYPWIGIEVVQDEYLKTRDLDQIGRTEDIYLGSSARLEAGYASTAFGSTRDAVMLRSTLKTGTAFSADQYILSSVDFSGRLEGGKLDNGLTEFATRYYLRHSPRRVFFASFSTSVASNLDPEQQLLLGGDTGLRGYPLRYLAGSTNALITLEERFYTNWQPLKLVNVGAAVFFDAGRSWGRDRYAGLADTAAAGGADAGSGWLKDVGFGLRLGSARSGLGNVLHFDVAFPLDGGSDISKIQFLVETRRSF